MISDAIELLRQELEKPDAGGRLVAASEEDLEQARQFGFPTVLLDLYRVAAPDAAEGRIELWKNRPASGQRVWSVQNAITENRDYVPGTYDFTLTGTGLNNGFGGNGIALQTDGKIVIVGNFNSYNGTNRNCIARLDPVTGLADSFNPNANHPVYSIAVQADGKVLAGGRFGSIGAPKRRAANPSPLR